MAFRRRADPERARAWRAWIAQHQGALERIGLPLAVYQDAAHWEDFLENGHLHWHADGPPFDWEELSAGQHEQLRSFLEEHGGDRVSPLLGWLRVRRQR